MENKIKNAIEYLNSIFGESNYEICGSTALFLRNKLDRIPNDIDIITKEIHITRIIMQKRFILKIIQ